MEINVDWDSVSTGESDPQNWSELIDEKKPDRKRSISVFFQPLQHEIMNKLDKSSTLMQKPMLFRSNRCHFINKGAHFSFLEDKIMD